jgi:hypothetical protein
VAAAKKKAEEKAKKEKEAAKKKAEEEAKMKAERADAELARSLQEQIHVEAEGEGQKSPRRRKLFSKTILKLSISSGQGGLPRMRSVSVPNEATLKPTCLLNSKAICASSGSGLGGVAATSARVEQDVLDKLRESTASTRTRTFLSTGQRTMAIRT